MRTTINIERDILETAKEIAKKEGKTTGTVISEMARRGFYAGVTAVAEDTAPYRLQDGVPILPPTGSLVSEESIRRIRDVEDI